MEITEYAKTSKIPLDILKQMAKRKFINNPLTDEDLGGLKLSEKTWRWRRYLRSQLSKFAMRERQTLIETCTLKTRWEIDAYSRMSNLILAGKEIHIEQIIRLIEWSFQFEMSHFQRQTIYRMRKALLKKWERKLHKEQEEQRIEDEKYDQMLRTTSS
jgi:hypothetical protein